MTVSSARPLVLVVDDDASVRGIVSELVEELGYDVVCAENGQEALERLTAARRPSLVLLDLIMPVMNGWEVLDAIRGRVDLETLPIVVFTASGRLPSDLAATDPEMTRPVLHKPIDPDLLLAMVSSFCESARDIESAPSDLMPKI
jgi:CheY-like chemotaxis protein